jgi:hypothetical protein
MLEYRGSLTEYHGPCLIIDPDLIPEHYRRQGRYAIEVANPFSDESWWGPDPITLYLVRPESIYIV